MLRFGFRFPVFLLLLLFVPVLTPAAQAGHGQANVNPETNLTAPEVRKLVDAKKAVIIDVRSLQEYKYSHIPGAINVPSPAVYMLRNRFPKDKSRLIVMYAGGGGEFANMNRAYNAAYKLGYTNMKTFYGGIREWIDNHYPVRKGTRP